MKAAVHTRYGPPGVVRISDVPTPSPREHELLVRVRATTVNRTDAAYLAARPFLIRLMTGLLRPKVAVLGNEFAGEVVATGTSVTAFDVGARVFGYCEGRFGAHAEYMTVHEAGPVAVMPAGTSFDEMAPSTEGSHYALPFLDKPNIGHGDDVLVNGATGAIGSAAVQLAKLRGANVTAVCDGANVSLVESLGADRVIDYSAEDFTKDEQRYDAVLDTVGKSSFRRCRRLLKPGGVYISSELGFLYQNPILVLVTPLMRGRRVLFPFPRIDQEMVRWIGDLIESGEYQPVVDRRYPLDRIVEAYTYVETGQKIGSVVISDDAAPPGAEPPDGS